MALSRVIFCKGKKRRGIRKPSFMGGFSYARRKGSGRIAVECAGLLTRWAFGAPLVRIQPAPPFQTEKKKGERRDPARLGAHRVPLRHRDGARHAPRRGRREGEGRRSVVRLGYCLACGMLRRTCGGKCRQCVEDEAMCAKRRGKLYEGTPAKKPRGNPPEGEPSRAGLPGEAPSPARSAECGRGARSARMSKEARR